MKLHLSICLMLTGLLPVSAHATDAHCVAVCEEQEGFCADRALQAIYDGEFRGSGCTDHEDCNQIVLMCPEKRTTCEADCE